jgi:hypothetical protein
MAELKKSKKKKRERKERRYKGEQTYASKVAVGIGVLGSLALGAGVWSQWLAEQPRDIAPYLIAGGALLLASSLFFGDLGTSPVRVGDGGVAVEKGRELIRILWCDLERVHAKDGDLLLEGKDDQALTITIAGQPRAVARIVAEGTRRVPEAMDVKKKALTGVPEISEHDGGELMTMESLQVAGRHCASSGKPISFERDARLCPQCCQVYLRDEVPKKCVTCELDLTDKTVRA